MLFTTFAIDDSEYKLRLTAASCIELEKRLGGKNPLNVVTSMEDGGLPSVTDVLAVLHASMQKYQSNISYKDVLNLYDNYVDSGQSYTDLIPVLLEVFKVSGFFPKGKVTE